MAALSSVKLWSLIHTWTSLVCTAFLLLLCLTGLPLIFHHEIDHALGYSVDPPAMPGASARASLDEIVADARARCPGKVVQFVLRAADEPDVWSVRLGKTVDAPDPGPLGAIRLRCTHGRLFI